MGNNNSSRVAPAKHAEDISDLKSELYHDGQPHNTLHRRDTAGIASTSGRRERRRGGVAASGDEFQEPPPSYSAAIADRDAADGHGIPSGRRFSRSTSVSRNHDIHNSHWTEASL